MVKTANKALNLYNAIVAAFCCTLNSEGMLQRGLLSFWSFMGEELIEVWHAILRRTMFSRKIAARRSLWPIFFLEFKESTTKNLTNFKFFSGRNVYPFCKILATFFQNKGISPFWFRQVNYVPTIGSLFFQCSKFCFREKSN